MDIAPQPKIFIKPWLTAVLLGVLFVAALGIRLYDLTDLPNDFYMVRQYRSMLIARGMYYENLASAPAWQRTQAVQQWQAQGLIEPPITEAVTAHRKSLPFHEVIHGWAEGSLHADDLDAGLERLGGDSDAGYQTASPDRHDQDVEIWH